MIRGVFFDLDGTLFDTVKDLLTTYRHVFARMGAVFDPAKLRIGPPLVESLKECKPGITPEEITDAVAAFKAFYDSCGFPETTAYDGVPEALAALHASGIKLFIATNKRLTPTLKILELRGVMPYFTDVYATDSITERKVTKAEYLQMAMEKYGLSPENCLMVGDTCLDVEAGHKAGLRVVGVAWGYDENGAMAAAGPEWVIRHAGELATLVKNL
ncbi:MAG: HAD-IA family hydrolase [Lentisphaeria bacterium]|nr:HAD-IA family hydrolase [Lentisphaeria bacterium]